MKSIAIAYLIIAGLLSLFTFAVYGWDKRQARIGGQRIPETRLHWLAWLGGWPGAMLGQNFFRHKTQKLNFRISTWGAALIHGSGVIAFSYFWLTRLSDV